MDAAGTVGVVCGAMQADEFSAAASRAVKELGLALSWTAASFEKAREFMGRKNPATILVDADGGASEFWEFLLFATQLEANSRLVVVGSLDATSVFRLRIAGVDAYSESLDLVPLSRALVVSGVDDSLLAVARRTVGRVGLKEAQKVLRAEMFREALRRVDGNRHAAARVLRIDRRYVLKMLKEI